MNTTEWLTLQDAADEIGVCPRTIRRRVADGSLPAWRIGPRTIRIKREDLGSLFLRIAPDEFNADSEDYS